MKQTSPEAPASACGIPNPLLSAARLDAPAGNALEFRQFGFDEFRMGAVARLDRDVERRALGGNVEVKTPVRDFENVGAEIAEFRRDAAEHARLIVDRQAEGGDAAFAFEFAHHDRGEDAGIDIATAQDDS